MSKRSSESSSEHPPKFIKIGQKQEDLTITQENNNHGNKGVLQDSGYSTSQGTDVQSVDYDDSGVQMSPQSFVDQESDADVVYSGYSAPQRQGKDDQSVDMDDSSVQMSPQPSVDQGIDADFVYSCDTAFQSDQHGDFLDNIRVDEESSEMSLTEMIKETGSKNRPYAENVLHCELTIGPKVASKQKKEKKDTETQEDHVLKLACALLNSGGGVLVVKITDFENLSSTKESSSKSSPPLVDKFWMKIEPKLKAMAEPSNYDDVYERHVESDEIFLFISAPKHFCTLDYNLHFPGDSGLHEASYQQTVDKLKESIKSKGKRHSNVDVPLKDLPDVPKVFTYKEKLDFHESKQIQLKHFKNADGHAETILDSNKRSQRDSIRKQISTFLNASGGVILVGVSDDGVVHGFNMKKNSKEDLEARLVSIVGKICNFTLQRKYHWDMEIIPVSGSESNAVLVIRVVGMKSFGGVFAKCPRSFELRGGLDSQEVVQLVFEEWKKRMLCGEDIFGNTDMDHFCKKFDKKLNTSKGPLLTVQCNDHVQAIKDAFFTVKDDFPVAPKGFESNLPKEAQASVKRIRKWCCRGNNRGLLAASHSWLGNPMEGVICDLLLISSDLGLHLFTLCHGGDMEAFQQYSREAAKSIKTRLVQDGACHEKFFISYHVVCCDHPEVCALTYSQYPIGYNLNREKLNKVLKALVLILATVPSLHSNLSNNMGVTIMNLLTKEQFMLLHGQVDINRELWVNGAAGTGKTLVAVEFMRKLHCQEKLDRHEILCVCENEGITQLIRESKLCNAVTRKTFMEKKNSFSEARHVIMDEVHNYRQESNSDESWYHKARKIVRQHDRNNPGYLWLFVDRSQTNHSYPMGMPSKRKPEFTLTTVIRNSKEIFRYSEKYLNKASVKKPLSLGHDFKGEIVKAVNYSTSTTSQSGEVKRILKDLIDKRYTCRDIAVLFSKEACIPDALLDDLQTINISTCNALGNDSDNVVVSTVNKYGGLERPVVVLVDLECSIPVGYKLDGFMYSGITRANVKLLIVKCEKCRNGRPITSYFKSTPRATN